MFQQVEGECATIVRKGRYKQVPVYTRDGYIFAKEGGCFIRLYADGSTSDPNYRLDNLPWEGPLARNKFGKLVDPRVVKDSLSLPDENKTLLLFGPSE
ncbi:hypothetical protein HDIA_0762 [Hartmannibacter diazotrophicus]|uniref:Uncharacterized protein n=1 Tax=Hartmannibacter diazotrophicus TaxID=1482074 RepID=A0A2C9D257_9HYPH|nr:hypothetical protein [Hartmannibacter diazotrophicus]SON54303.1 hypothetical protein HDIA_0762 [Hartmannibacter diazotrophicus]